MLNIKTIPSSLFVQAGAEEKEGEEAEPGDGDFNWHCKSGLAKNIQLVKDEFCKERGLKPFKIAITGKPCAGKSFFSKQLADHFNVPHIHKEQVLADIQQWNAEKQREYEHRVAEKARLAKLAADREEERLRLIAEEEERKKQAEIEEKERLKAEMGSDYQSEAEIPPEEDQKEEGEPGEGEAKEEQKKEAEEEKEPEKNEAMENYERQLA